ncbi:hypothetical protein M1N06_04285 [Peptococcaceae bacterium]|nr:hypothetical protein [Peptococcaceae bacterium]
MPGSDKIIWRTTGFKGGLMVGMSVIAVICYTNMVAIPLLYLLYESRFGEYVISYVVFLIGMFLFAVFLVALVEITLARLINKIFFIFRISPGKTVVIATDVVAAVIWVIVLFEHLGIFEHFGLWTPGVSDHLPETVNEWMVNTYEFFSPIEEGYLVKPSRLKESYKYSFPPPSP